MMPNSLPINEFFASIAVRGRTILGIKPSKDHKRSAAGLIELCHLLVSSKGDASGIALSFEILDCYQNFGPDEKTAFFLALKDQFSADVEEVRRAAEAYCSQPSSKRMGTLATAIEPARRQLIIRLNQAPNATLLLIQMRADLLVCLGEHPELKEVDRDFSVLFASWFNGGFLQLQSLDWSSPAAMLENIMRYEAVHGMSGWNDLRDRIAPADRLIYGFFHPRLGNEPLIFIEVALMKDAPSDIASILEPTEVSVSVDKVRTAVFYSISNCQKGLRGIPLGSFLIKQVVEDLKKSYPQLKEFVTLSPVPGFVDWLKKIADAERSEYAFLSSKTAEQIALILNQRWVEDEELMLELQQTVKAAAARYLSVEKDSRALPIDSVARFHLGNGASLDRINWPADISKNGLASACGLMVNYRYNLEEIEQNHEHFVRTGEVHLSPSVSKLAKTFDKSIEKSQDRQLRLTA